MMNNFLDIEKFEETLNDVSRHIEIEYDGLDITTTNLKSLKPDEISEVIEDRLMDLPKLERNITIGKMIKKNPDLRKQIDAKIIDLFNGFIKANNILEEKILATTPDSILITNRIVMS